MNENFLDLYLKQMGSVHKRLTYDEQRFLAKNYLKTRDIQSRDKLIYSTLPLVVVFASCYKNKGVPLIDLIQEGNMGVIQAVEKYNCSTKFSTYSGFLIKKRIFLALSTQARTIIIPPPHKRVN